MVTEMPEESVDGVAVCSRSMSVPWYLTGPQYESPNLLACKADRCSLVFLLLKC